MERGRVLKRSSIVLLLFHSLNSLTNDLPFDYFMTYLFDVNKSVDNFMINFDKIVKS
jgi:hypothetical protein